MNSNLKGLFALAALSLLAAAPAKAGLIGDTLSWQYYAYGGAYTYDSGTTSGTFVDTGSGVNATFIGGTSDIYFNIETTNTQIIFSYSVDNQGSGPWGTSALSLSPTIYNGIAINLVSGSAFTNVTIDPATNMAGFNSSDLSFTASQIQVNWAGLSFSTSTEVVLDVTTSSVPEPATFALIGSALLLLGASRWRRQRR